MSKLHYFQRYDGKENWITNATLLLLSRFNHFSRRKFESAMNSILADSNLSLNIDVNFNQQKWGESSVVDGVISQESFKIVIETKLYDNFSANQLIRHLDAIGENHSQKILLTLSKNKVDGLIKTKIINTLKQEKYSDIRFASTTYEDIYQVLYNNTSDTDVEMKEILDDYISLCEEFGLTNIGNRTMLAFTAKDSLNENLKYRIYYDPITRNHSYTFKYIGLYQNKKIVAVGKLEKIVVCNYEGGKLVDENGEEVNNLTPDEYNRIKETIENTDYYELEYDNKFFLVDNFFKTNFEKTSFSSLRAKKYFWLDEIDGFKEGMSAEQLAKLLDEKEWK